MTKPLGYIVKRSIKKPKHFLTLLKHVSFDSDFTPIQNVLCCVLNDVVTGESAQAESIIWLLHNHVQARYTRPLNKRHINRIKAT